MDSWIDIRPDSDFSLANLPFGIVTTPADDQPHAAVAIGDYIVDLKVLATQEGFGVVFPPLLGHADIFSQSTLNAFAELGRSVHREVRTALQGLLRTDPVTAHPAFLRDNVELRAAAVLPQRSVKLHLPMAIGDYTDFYAGVHHAHTVGTLFRGADRALMPNYATVPVGYHGRASSVVVSGTPVRRPWGQLALDSTVVTAPSRRLDMELELGCFVARPNTLGTAVPVDAAANHIFGYVLLNDWSARDIQSYEYVPLGPFNGKNFCTTISPWVVLADALAPFRVPALPPSAPLQPYLREAEGATVFDLTLSVDLTTPEGDTTTISRTCWGRAPSAALEVQKNEAAS
ncbi:fumarylacetoacetate hydrolase family protein [Niveomyces insectorum RCEF 264]|uniref:Fumarylacetoacetase n=1 Tax=Niveomyces insectorum RCEF 264 TaxID=1081102 RepID=A0A167SSS8_9HYPO|nr:fumarylacetoacetate hydrolase family protein [Niveomyces insectorum RCEF 264]